MKSARLSPFLCIILCGVAPATTQAADLDESREPPQILYVEAGGQKVPVELDKPFDVRQLKGAGTFTLRAEPYRLFHASGISFQYPSGYSFDYSKDPASIWTLNGNDCVVMVVRYNAVKDADAARADFIKGMEDHFKKQPMDQRPIAMEVGEQTLRGVRISFKLGDIAISQDIFTFPSDSGVVMLMVQDLPRDDGKLSDERTRLNKMLKETLRPPK